ncbi:MAG: hypothetical protein CBC12_07250 [Candidatus Puniceispirillum sp. TMED52]|jgi:hypothetical protein|nr:MAG: hypothetical protein CBC12_07250 [Candidatus Puniceispirillum sp. TMED52]|tara:strand:+ start:7482 stop:8597 length:1116 start_codon:yes stop_codon:yes gene_type:complete
MWQLAVFVVLLLILHVRRKEREVYYHTVTNNHSSCVKMTLCSKDGSNEALILETVLCDKFAVFQIDTGYAGAPVISKSYLASQTAVTGTDVCQKYASAIKVSRKASEDEVQRALRSLLKSGLCRSFTSGCTMRLMGIGSTNEMQSDMLLCKSLALKNVQGEYQRMGGQVDADVFVTHSLKGGVHILTCDYLLHRSPSVLCPADEKLWLGLSEDDKISMEPSFKFHESFFVGGSFAIMMTVGGVPMRVVVDTGATAPLSVSKSSSTRIKKCSVPTGGVFNLIQTGVNGERICSSSISVNVKIGSVDLGNVIAFVNNEDVEGADAYAGLGMLRALDLWLEPHRIGIRRNRLQPSIPRGRPGACEGAVLPPCAL